MYAKEFKKKGASIWVEAHGEILFEPGGSVRGWNQRLVNRIKRYTAEAAPANKRHRWSHDSTPTLKRSFVSSQPKTVLTRKGARIFAAVGSTSPYARYVDQGTGVHAGHSPFEVKILPPWEPGSPSLYEAAWIAPGHSRGMGPLIISGQKGQFFFRAGLERAFAFMKNRAAQVADERKIALAEAAFPPSLGIMPVNPNRGSFESNLSQWREWRDAVYGNTRNRDRRVSVDRRKSTVPAGERLAKKREKAAERARAYRQRHAEQRNATATQISRQRLERLTAISVRNRNNSQVTAANNAAQVRALRSQVSRKYPGAVISEPIRQTMDGVSYWSYVMTYRGQRYQRRVKAN